MQRNICKVLLQLDFIHLYNWQDDGYRWEKDELERK